ncbi:hypothetical protein DRN69_03120 [Candidatus Pacearchaeota archaeon]|nr:MAG: hypothetical protein DRN69_03120 [Candidatus Pacearchaeota archaeon]
MTNLEEDIGNIIHEKDSINLINQQRKNISIILVSEIKDKEGGLIPFSDVDASKFYELRVEINKNFNTTFKEPLTYEELQEKINFFESYHRKCKYFIAPILTQKFRKNGT